MNDDCEIRGLGEHFFRHEYGRLTAVLVRRFGVAHLQLIEDAVQSALTRALQAWRQRGLPREPAAWLTRAALNAAVDSLRRRDAEQRALDRLEGESLLCSEADSDILLERSPQDEPLRLLFLCCHPDVPLESRIALALRTVSGFSVEEVAAVLLITKASAEKRASRAKDTLRSIGAELVHLDAAALQHRLPTVQSAIYLLFTEGYASSSPNLVLRRDLCEEAIRLARMLTAMPDVDTSASAALLALMLFHTSRFDARLNAGGASVLLDQQNRTLWDWQLIREAMYWMQRSTSTDQVTRFHIEAAIAWEHCRSSSHSETDWNRVAELYDVLRRISDVPMVRLNHAIAIGYAAGPKAGLDALISLDTDTRKRLRPWWDCAVADAYERSGCLSKAESYLRDALALANNADQREVIRRKLTAITDSQ